ncbi:unnamed protein product [Urochloa humidicola]
MALAPLSDLPLGRAHCGVCVRVVRMWDYCGNKEDAFPLHVDMVLVDDKKNRMYAEIPGSEAEKFKPLIKEGEIYVFKKFIVSGSKPAYKPFPGHQMIRFTPWTTVQETRELAANIPKYVYDLVDFEEFPSRVGQVEYFVDAIGLIVGVSQVAHVHLPSSTTSTAKRIVCLKDLRNNRINLVLWGSRATDFDAETVHSIGQQSPVVAIFVGMLVKSYKGDNTLSGGTACKWYINEEIPEIENYFDRVYDQHDKIDWISAGEQQFRDHEQQKNLEEKTVMQLRDIDPWEFERRGYRCTVTISRINQTNPWWFSSCTKCHRASVPNGNQYRCSGGCLCTTAEPKYRLSLIGTDGTASAEFVVFGKFARQIIGKPVVSLIRSANKNQAGSANNTDHLLPEIAAVVSQKFTFSVSVTQRSLTQRNVSFQVNGIVAVYGKQTSIPRSIDGPPSSSNHTDSALTLQQTRNKDDDEPTPAKKPRMSNMIPISCKKGSQSQSARMATQENQSALLLKGPHDSTNNQETIEPFNIEQSGQNDELRQTAAAVTPERDPEKNPSTSQSGIELKSQDERKKRQATKEDVPST